MENRYRVDARVGCVAVIDAEIGTDSPGLHRDDPHVVAYWHGRRVPRWKRLLRPRPTPAFWEVRRGDLRAARALAEKLNEEERRRR